jgi:hypothetical protein
MAVTAELITEKTDIDLQDGGLFATQVNPSSQKHPGKRFKG